MKAGRISVAVVVFGIALQLGNPSLTPGIVDGQLTIETRGVTFITGRPLDRLRDGGSVTYTFRIVVSTERRGRSLGSREHQFVLSYDLWEERFAVAELGTPTRSVSNLTSEEAEAWCLNNLALPIGGIRENTPLWLRLEYRAVFEDTTLEGDENPGFGLGGLISIFSRREENEVPEGMVETGPFRLSDLR